MEAGNKDWIWLLAGFGVVAAVGGGLWFFTKRKKVGTAEESSVGGKNTSSKIKLDPVSGTAGVKVEGTTDPWDSNFWKDMSRQIGGKVKILTVASANNLAKVLYDAKGVFNDDEDGVYAAIGALKSKTQLSYLSEVFLKNHKTGLKDYLKSFLSEDEELPKVNTMVAALPAYT